MNNCEALNQYISNFFSMHPARIQVMVELILSLLKIGNVQYQKLAQGTSFEVKNESTIRRIQRFFAEEFLNPTIASKLIFSLFTWNDKIVLTLDRTNWKFGEFEINFLVIAAVYKGCSIPIRWILLPHKGNSKTDTRIKLMEMVLEVIPANRIKFLTADREFIGCEWFKFLRNNNISFCIRIKENTLVTNTRKGGNIKLKDLFHHLCFGQSRELEQIIGGINLRIFGIRIASGDLLIVAISENEKAIEALESYSIRWTIETMFKSFKTAGFNFESTHIKNSEYLYKMMILLTIAYSWAVQIGEIKNNLKPIKVKTNKRLEFSLFNYGFRTIQIILLKGIVHKKTGINLQEKLIQLLECITLKLKLLPELAEITVVY